jgi:hypothetical protein
VGTDPENLRREAFTLLANQENDRQMASEYSRPPLWDGHAAPRIVESVLQFLRKRYS